MDATQEEEWRPVVGWEGHYEVSDHGRVRSLDRTTVTAAGPRRYRGRILKLNRDRRGYLLAGFSKPGGRYRQIRVHLLVLQAFVAPRPLGLIACHNDGNNQNNHVSNLRWDTWSSNGYDRVQHGRHFNQLKTHCPQGHPYDAENTYINPSSGGRNCRKCQAAAVRKFTASRRPKGWQPKKARTHCANGHEFAPENTYHRPDGARACKQCHRIALRKFRAKR